MTGGASLADALRSVQSRQRLHMPGHFGRVSPVPAAWGAQAAAWDQTESMGLDALSLPTGVLEAVSERAAAAYGARAAWLSVQGATLPVLAGSLALAAPGGRVLADRRSHRSVLAAAILGGWQVDWVCGEAGDPPDVAAWLRKLSGPRPDLVVPLYPSYEGLGRDLAPVVAQAHARGSRVLVDAAHGSHLGRATGLPPHPLAWGADLVAHGLHKTEPVLTQAGLLLAGPGAPAVLVLEWMRRLATSSPSYLLLASMEQYAEQRAAGDGGWIRFAAQMHDVWEQLAQRGWQVRQRVWSRAGQLADPAKLTVEGDGLRLAERLRRAGFEPEHADAAGVTLIAGPALGFDSRDWDRVIEALGDPVAPASGRAWWPAPAPAVLSPAAAVRAPRRRVGLGAAAERVAAAEITPYPPGVPVAVPGEHLSGEVVQWLEEAAARGVRLEGVDTEGGEVAVWVVHGDA